MMNLAFRNVKLYFRDRAAVLYSMLGVFIIIGLYVLFLGDMMTSGMADIPGSKAITDSWVMAGLIGVTSLTTTLGALGTIVEDRDRKISKDFSAAPLKRAQISGGYLLSSLLIGFLMCTLTLVLSQIYIVSRGGQLLTLVAFLKVLGIMALSVLTSSTMMFPVVMSVRSNNAYAGISTVVGTLVGFLTGMYIPMGEVPAAVQVVMKCFPTTHAVALLRQTMLAAPEQLAVQGLPQAVSEPMLAEINEFLGVTLRFGNTVLPAWAHVAVLVGTSLVFFGLSVFILSRRKGK